MASLADLNCIIVLDDSVKSKMKINIGDLSNYGAIIIDNIKQITSTVLEKTNKVLILGYYRSDGLDELKLFREVLKLDYYLITDDKLLCDLLKDFCKCFNMDYTTVTSNMIYSVLYDDKGEQSKFRLTDTAITKEEDIYRILESSTDVVTRELCNDYIRLRKILDEKLLKEKKYISDIRRLDSQVLNCIQENTVLSSTLKNMVEKVIDQSKNLKDLEVAFTEDFYNNIQTSKYPNRPKILYLKEYQEIIHESSFLKTLFYAIRDQGKLSCKVVRLHDSYDVVRIKNLESSYHLVNNQFLESNVVKSDFVLSYGNYSKLLDFLLTNKYKLDVLIIVDCKKFEKFYDVVLNGFDVIYYNLCRNKKFAEKLGLNPYNTVTNNNNNSMLSWDSYKEYDYNKDNELAKFLFLSSRPVIKSLYRMIKDS